MIQPTIETKHYYQSRFHRLISASIVITFTVMAFTMTDSPLAYLILAMALLPIVQIVRSYRKPLISITQSELIIHPAPFLEIKQKKIPFSNIEEIAVKGKNKYINLRLEIKYKVKNKTKKKTLYMYLFDKHEDLIKNLANQAQSS